MSTVRFPRSWLGWTLTIVGVGAALALAGYAGVRGIGALTDDEPPGASQQGAGATPLAGGIETAVDPERQAACKALIAEFGRYPLVWTGDTLLGHELRGCQHTHGESADFVTFVYGTCILPNRPEPSCSPPAQIQISAPCGPQTLGGFVGGKTEIRGAPATIMTDGVVRIEARGMTVNIVAPGSPRTRQNQADKVAELLIPANDPAAALKPGDSLNVPDPVKVGPSADAPAGEDTTTTAGCLEAINADYGPTEDVLACNEKAAAYAALPLVYPGDRIIDYRLGLCGAGLDGEGRDKFSFRYVAYRECAGRDAGGICLHLLDLEVRPPCTPDAPLRSSMLSEAEFRGAPARIRRDRVYLDAPAYKLTIQGSLQEEGRWPEIATAVIDALVPANELAAALKPGDPLSVVPATENAACP